MIIDIKDTPQFIRRGLLLFHEEAAAADDDRGKKVVNVIIKSGANGEQHHHYYLPQSYTQAFVHHGSKLKLNGIRM
jgi:hypothetical protein